MEKTFEDAVKDKQFFSEFERLLTEYVGRPTPLYFAKNTSIPEKYFSFLRDLTPKFIDTRYPDMSVDLPSNIYDKVNTGLILIKSEEVLKWIEKNLKD